MKNRYGMLVVAAMMVGCASSSDHLIRDRTRNRPPAYQDGYADGCQSGQADIVHSSTKYKKDAGRIASDKLYTNGWYDGFEECKASYIPPVDRDRRN
ncbi:MAG: hypothetical protein WC073_07495 [Sterolibacterium sp.]